MTEDPGKVIDGATALLKQTTEQAEFANEAATNAQNAANHAEVQAEIAKENADHADRIISAGFLLANNLTIKDGKICVVYKEGW